MAFLYVYIEKKVSIVAGKIFPSGENPKFTARKPRDMNVNLSID